MENNHNKPTLFTLQEMLSPLNAIKEIFEERRGWWNSWELALNNYPLSLYKKHTPIHYATDQDTTLPMAAEEHECWNQNM